MCECSLCSVELSYQLTECSWGGSDLVTLLADYGVRAETLNGLLGKLNHGLAVNNEGDARLLSQKNEILISHFFRIAHYLTTENYRFQHDYKVVIQKTLVPKNGTSLGTGPSPSADT